MSEILLETHALTKQFRRHKAVSEIDMHIKRGAIYGFIGRNGAGKTTFLKMISGLTAPSSGDYSLFGYSGKDLSKVRSRVGCLIEEPGLYKNMSAFDNMMIKAKMFGINDKKYVLGLLDEVGLSDVGRKKTKNFSLGMKQRLGIALAMVGNPDFLVLDEPINGLDPQGIVEVRYACRSCQGKKYYNTYIESYFRGTFKGLHRFWDNTQGKTFTGAFAGTVNAAVQ